MQQEMCSFPDPVSRLFPITDGGSGRNGFSCILASCTNIQVRGGTQEVTKAEARDCGEAKGKNYNSMQFSAEIPNPAASEEQGLLIKSFALFPGFNLLLIRALDKVHQDLLPCPNV